METTRKTYRFDPSVAETGMRLDRFLTLRVAGRSRAFWRDIIDLGGVHVGGRRVRRCSHTVTPGDKVEAYLDGLPLPPFSLAAEDIVFRDPYLLAVAKPAGVETQPTPARYKGTLYEALLRFLQDPFRPLDRPALGMVQRLDRETSGLLLFSIHPRAHRGLSAVFSGRAVEKTYLALVTGTPREGVGEFRSLLARSRASNRMKSVSRGGKEALTRYRVVEDFTDAALVEVEIPTGRSHQIRVHFSEAGHPLLGDVRYGGPASLRGRAIPRQMLHARSLRLAHPVSKQPLSLEAPIPPDMEAWLQFLRQESNPSDR
jgi:23S rRNA pseudouridine1911/1915/1917 synthase